MRLTSVALLCSTLLAAGAAPATANAQPAPVPGQVSRASNVCYRETMSPWLVSVVFQEASNTKSLEALVADFVRGPAANQARALGYLNDWRAGKHASGEAMAGTHFNTCMGQQAPAEPLEPSRAISCYKEQRLLFALQDLRFEREVSQAEATEHLLKANPSDAATQAAIRRLALSTYTLLKPGSESAFSEAQFRVCMTTP